jgi:hypothetical protein
MSEILSTEHQDILDRFLDSLTEGGIPAGRIMVAGVIAEEEAALILKETAHHIEKNEDASEVCGIQNMYKVVEAINFIDGIQDEYNAFESRRKFAQKILNRTINKNND